MNPETGARADDRLVTVISRWLARHVSNEELREELDAQRAGLAPDQAEAVDELRAELEASGPKRAELERVARETLEALALGG